MIKQISIFSCFLSLILFSSCKKESVDSKLTYNQKANEVIQQFVLDESCGCIMEIPKKSMIKIILEESPAQNVREQLIEKLHLRDRKELDSIEKLSDNFVLDSNFLKDNNITLVKEDSFIELSKDPNFCQKGILCIRKPIFDKEYRNAIIDYGWAFMCLSPVWEIYKYEDGNWKRKKN